MKLHMVSDLAAEINAGVIPDYHMRSDDIIFQYYRAVPHFQEVPDCHIHINDGVFPYNSSLSYYDISSSYLFPAAEFFLTRVISDPDSVIYTCTATKDYIDIWFLSLFHVLMGMMDIFFYYTFIYYILKVCLDSFLLFQLIIKQFKQCLRCNKIVLIFSFNKLSKIIFNRS